MSKWGCGFKVYDLKGDKLPNKNFLFPFVDIFMCEQKDDKIYLSSKQCAKAWPAEYYMKDELFPLKLWLQQFLLSFAIIFVFKLGTWYYPCSISYLVLVAGLSFLINFIFLWMKKTSIQ